MYEKYKLNDLRSIAREIGVKSPTNLKKVELISQIESIKSGKQQPYFSCTGAGRPPIKPLNSVKFLNEETKQFIKQEVELQLKNMLNKLTD